MLTERTGEISTVDGGEEVTTGEERDRRDRMGKAELLDSGACSESQSLACSVRKKRQEVHPGMGTLDGRVSENEEQEVKVAVFVKDRELIVYNEWVCEWEERTEGRRQRDRVFYSPQGQTSHVLTPTQLSRSLLWSNILSIRSGICVPLGSCGGARSS